MTIFTGEHERDGTGWVLFIAYVDGRRVVNRVSDDALHDYFGVSRTSGAEEGAYRRHRLTIDGVARIMIDAGVTNAFGGADVGTEAVERWGIEADEAAARAGLNVLPFKPRK